MRLAGVLLLSSLPIWIGIWSRQILQKRVNFLHTFARFIRFAKEQIRFSGRELPEIFSLALRSPVFSKPLWEELFCAVKDGQSVEKILKNRNDIRLKNEDIQMVSEFLSGLGTSDVEGQVEHAAYSLIQCEELKKEAAHSFAVQGKLTVSLAGALAAALFIWMV